MSTKPKKSKITKKSKKTVLDVTRIEKYFETRLFNPEYTRSKCARIAGFSAKTSAAVIEGTKQYKERRAEYEDRLQDVQRDKTVRINEAMAAYKVSAKDLIGACAGIVETSEDEKTVIAATKQITDITQDKQKETVDHNIPGMEVALSHLFKGE